MASRKSGVYGGVPAEARAARRRERLLDACLDSLYEDGWRATSVRAICGRGGLNPRYFYESFSGLEELLAAVFESIAADAARSVAAAREEAPATPRGQFEAIVRGFVVATTDDPRRAHVAFLEALGSESLMRGRIEAIHGLATVIATVAASFHDDLDPGTAAVHAQVLAGGVVQTVIAHLEGTLEGDRDELIERCATLMPMVMRAARRR